MGQAFSMLGADGPRLNKLGRLDWRLGRAFRSWKIVEAPIPSTALQKLTSITRNRGTPQQIATTDLMWLGYFSS